MSTQPPTHQPNSLPLPEQVAGRQASTERHFVQIIDLHTREPAELERLFNQWRTSSLAREHIATAELEHDAADVGHLVLEIEYESVVASSSPFEPSAEAAGVVALLDRPPHFRASDS